MEVFVSFLLVKDLREQYASFIGKEISCAGWIRTVRVSKNVGFIELNDGTSFANVQVVFTEELPDFETISKLGVGTAIAVNGTVVASPGKEQVFEIAAQQIAIVGRCDPDYPLQKKRHSFEFLRTIAYLRPRTNTFSAIFRVRSLLAHAIHTFFQDRGFVYVHTPIITGSDCEGAGQMFRVTTLDPKSPPLTEEGFVDFSKDFFGRQTNLTVSGQLAVENFCMAFRNVYTFGPTFRAENSNTPRHAAEFWMIEPEIAFAGLEEDMRLAEDMTKFMIRYVLEKTPDEMRFFNTMIDKGLLDRLEKVASAEFGHITYTEAVDILKKSGRSFEFPVEWGRDLQTEHERYLTEEVFKKPIFVTDYPREIKAFYMRQNDDGKTVAAMDMLVPGVGELIGGSQREERYDYLLRRIEELGLKKEDYWWYLDLRRFGGCPHAGFGLGFDRAIMYVTGMTNIRDVQPFPRTPKNAEF